ncbi:MAG: hypothetical protein R8M37_04285 [Alphaproteobacteria bacterium]|nr:hypothetical protein [Alphaproteobacteria bacterium]
MALKPKIKRRIFLTILCTICAFVLVAIIVPPMITLNKFRPMIEKSVYEQTHVPAKLNGSLHFSLIGGATIVAHDVTIPTAKIGSVMFSIPFRGFFDIENAKLNGPVVIYDADITVDKLEPANFNHNIEIYNSNIKFKGRKFHIVRADFTDGAFHGTIRTKEHKYDVEFIGDTFYIKNKNNNLDITGQFYSDGSIRGHMSIETKNINEWFGFKEPKINRPIKLTTNFEWDGGTGYKFTNIESDNFSGNIEILPNGDKDIQLVSNDMTFDFSFLLKPNRILHKTKFNLDLYGNLTFADRDFKHLKIDAVGTSDKFQIANIIADDIAITGGTITQNGAENILITMPYDGTNVMCLFSGTPEKWSCSEFTYGNLSGSISVNGDKFDVTVQSDTPMPTNDKLMNIVSRFGKRGTIKFQFSDIGGTYTITPNGVTPSYNFAQNKTLKWLNINLPFLPEFMLSDVGNFSWANGMLTFTPHNKQWQLSTYDNYFYLTGRSFKTWFPGIDLQSINDDDYIISGFFQDDKISNLNISVSGHEFNGSVSGKNITLHTKTLSLDTFTNQAFLDNFAELEFLTNAPILIPFDLPVNISLSADSLIYNGNEYQNFVYALKPGTQTFSITDSARGNLLATIEQDKTNYDIFIQLNQFVINGKLLSSDMPLNIRDTMITAEIALSTSGQIAHDIYYNMTGTLDMTFNDGYIIGMSFDNFYASAENITTLNAEYALANALTTGETRLKKMHMVGTYERDNFITTKPIELSMRHTDGIGGLAITDGMMTAEFDLTLRGTAPEPATIALSVLPNGDRKYSLSEIMQNIDPGFMRAFIKTHTKF